MNTGMYILFGFIVIFRLYVLFISKKHEKKLLKAGGKESGKNISKLLAILHTGFYFSAFFEGNYKNVHTDSISILGIVMLVFSFCVLISVIKILGEYWTVKLIFVDQHILNTNWLFKYVKHPNYYLNIIPELIGVTLIFHAWITMFVFIVPYGICLYLRIKEENQLLSKLK